MLHDHIKQAGVADFGLVERAYIEVHVFLVSIMATVELGSIDIYDVSLVVRDRDTNVDRVKNIFHEIQCQQRKRLHFRKNRLYYCLRLWGIQ